MLQENHKKNILKEKKQALKINFVFDSRQGLKEQETK